MKTKYTLIFWVIFASLLSQPIVANHIGYVDYDIPYTTHSWKVANEETKKDKGITTTVQLYVPYTDHSSKTMEFFGSSYSSEPGTPHDQATLTNLLQNQFPNKQVNLNIIESSPESVLYEWSVSQKGKESMHGWNRIFSKPEGTVMLGYVTQDVGNAASLRPIWIKALKDAKVKP